MISSKQCQSRSCSRMQKGLAYSSPSLNVKIAHFIYFPMQVSLRAVWEEIKKISPFCVGRNKTMIMIMHLYNARILEEYSKALYTTVS